MWFSDSDELEDMFHFRTQGCEEFWKWFHERHRIYDVAKVIPPALLKNLVIKPLLRNSNAPEYWKNHGMKGRVFACQGKGMTGMTSWDDVWCEKDDYAEAQKNEFGRLDHGYDERKPDEDLDLEDMRAAANFRGGECVSSSMVKGDLYTKLQWKCHDGHVFAASPYTVLKAGHWGPECCLPDRTWEFDILAKKIPFYAQIWYDTHEENENVAYSISDGVASVKEFNE